MKCGSNNTKKNGKKRGIQRYKCLECKSNFSSKRREKQLQKIIFKEYFYKRQTLEDLTQKHGKCLSWIKLQISQYEPSIKEHKPRAVNLICDATFYGKRKDKLGTLVFKDSVTKEILIWKHIQSEKILDYKQLLQILLSLGYRINSITIDGKRGLFKAFNAYSVQMCHFHQRSIIRRYITKNPKLEASKDLKKIMSTLTKTNQINFTKKLYLWHKKYENFINEKTINIDTNKSHYTHQKLRSAYRSLKTNLPYLFTYKNYPNLDVHNTTNSLDGGVFSPMKMLMKIHRGSSKCLRLKMVDDYLVNCNKI